MEYRLIALGLKLALVAFVTGVAGFGVWVAGAVAVTSFWVGSDIANSMNAVFSFGLVGGIAAAWIGPRANGTALLESAGGRLRHSVSHSGRLAGIPTPCGGYRETGSRVVRAAWDWRSRRRSSWCAFGSNCGPCRRRRISHFKTA